VALGLVSAEAARDVYGQADVPDARTLRLSFIRDHVAAVRSGGST
jgi:hypothetical protein